MKLRDFDKQIATKENGWFNLEDIITQISLSVGKSMNMLNVDAERKQDLVISNVNIKFNVELHIDNDMNSKARLSAFSNKDEKIEEHLLTTIEYNIKSVPRMDD